MPLVNIQTLSGRQLQLQITSRIQVNILIEQIRKLLKLENDSSVRLTFKGESLNNFKSNETILLNEGDVILAFPVRKAPSEKIRKSFMETDQQVDEEEEELTRFKLNESSPYVLKSLAKFLKEKMKFPDWVLVAIFGLNKWVYISIILFIMGGPIAHKYDLGPIYVIAWILALIFMNLGKRKPGEMSAYSVFNEGFQELPGQFNAQQVDQQIRRGQM
eukprot:TRINITY_DN5189_c0_g1_i1.p2 TRINITY_DN5189_c0_g1~~TRINITY_DN5189_c0_g1_i1.p2  ORF type:complete len:217 (-),score=21.63 TRINITY_DN5189_c0_g1_i1:368-1018(-)